MDTIWKNIEDYEGYYVVSSEGDINSVDRVINGRLIKGQPMKKFKDEFGYNRVSLCKNGVSKKFRVCRIVAKTYPEICGEWFESCQVNHNNYDVNDDRAENLVVCSASFNTLYSIEGRKKNIVRQVGKFKNGVQVDKFPSIRKAAEKSNISRSMIWKCLSGYRSSAGGYEWRYL